MFRSGRKCVRYGLPNSIKAHTKIAFFACFLDQVVNSELEIVSGLSKLVWMGTIQWILQLSKVSKYLQERIATLMFAARADWPAQHMQKIMSFRVEKKIQLKPVPFRSVPTRTVINLKVPVKKPSVAKWPSRQQRVQISVRRNKVDGIRQVFKLFDDDRQVSRAVAF